MWFWLFFKRNFKHFSFIFILLLIPFFAVAMKGTVDADSSVLKIGYTCNGEGDNALNDVFESIKKEKGAIHYLKFKDEKEGIKALGNAEIDSLWVFDNDLKASIERFIGNKEEHVIKILNREDNEINLMAEEKLYCFIYPQISLAIFNDFMKNDIEDANKLSEKELLEYYNYKDIKSNIVEIKTIDTFGKEKNTEVNFLISATKGILSLLVLISSFAAAAYIKEDESRGLFVLFSPIKQFVLKAASLISALIPTTTAFIFSLCIMDLFSLKEIPSLLLLVLSSLSISLCALSVFTSKKSLCIALPVIITASAALSPIFLNVKAFPVIQGLLPTYYYLYSLTNPNMLLPFLIYFVITLLTALSIHIFCLNKK